ncbi:MAG TPA: hypothetical protein P5239_00990, partial [Victivallales bacterium]|nr:hypothetical protein [Victivallales bacterium]
MVNSVKNYPENKLTPMMRQYLDAKRDIPKDCILLFRMGDFYEVFFEDANRAAPLLEVALTKRAGVPMCGVPYHALESYLPRLLEAGVKVAIAEQMEDPRLAKGIVKRAVTRIITPGTIIEGSVLSPEQNNFLSSFSFENKVFGLASIDISTGEFRCTELEKFEDIQMELLRLKTPECIISETLALKIGELKLKEISSKILWTKLEDWIFDFNNAEDLLKRHFKTTTLDGFGCRELTAAISAAGAILYYISENLRQNASHVHRISVYKPGNCAIIDSVTQRNLELVESISGDKNSTLLSVLDKTVTPMGARLLREWILRPLRSKEQIEERLSAVEVLKDDPVGLSELQEVLSASRDIQRISAKINMGSATPRDVKALAQSLEIIPSVKQILSYYDAVMIVKLRDSLPELPELVDEINSTINENPPALIADGGFIKEGFSNELDQLKKAST